MKSREEIEKRIESLKVNNPELLENEIWQLALEWVLSD